MLRRWQVVLSAATAVRYQEKTVFFSLDHPCPDNLTPFIDSLRFEQGPTGIRRDHTVQIFHSVGRRPLECMDRSGTSRKIGKAYHDVRIVQCVGNADGPSRQQAEIAHG